jgi:hypothetical protein
MRINGGLKVGTLSTTLAGVYGFATGFCGQNGFVFVGHG